MIRTFVDPTFNEFNGQLATVDDFSDLEKIVEKEYTLTGNILMRAFNDKFHLGRHLFALREYLLLGKGDFIQVLMQELKYVLLLDFCNVLNSSDLFQNATEIYRHNLSATLESAIRSSSASHDDSEVLNRLDVRLLQV